MAKLRETEGSRLFKAHSNPKFKISNRMTYLETAAQFYSEVAQTPQVGLCCVQSTPLQLPGLKISLEMQQMNYGCGTTVHPTELANEPTVLYVGIGGGLEALQFSYFLAAPVLSLLSIQCSRCGGSRT